MTAIATPTRPVPTKSDRLIERLPLFGTGIDRVTMTDAVALLLGWARSHEKMCRCVFTPNVDHVVKMRKSERLRAAYRDASLVVADGWPLVRASKWLDRPLPERVAGSDLVPNTLEASHIIGGLRVFLLGGRPGVPETAAAEIERRWPYVEVVGAESPPFGFDRDPAENERVLDLVERAEPDLLIVGLGAPRQELWLHQHQARLRAAVAIGAGATIDFLAGEQTRAPGWIQRLGLEWFYRAARDPRRLAGRYAHDLMVFPRICAEEWLKQGKRDARRDRVAGAEGG